MKFFHFLIVAILFYSTISAQTKLDSMLVNVNQSSVNSGIIYERVTQFANLYSFNKTEESNTATYKYFRQALSELHNASNQTRLISLDELENRIANTTQDNQVEVAILNTPFHILNYNYENQNAGGLLLDETNDTFSEISGQPSFFELQTTIVSPTKSILKGLDVTFIFNEELYLTNEGNSIKTLTMNFGSNTQTIISDGILNTQTINIPYYSSGTKTIECHVIYNDDTELTTKASFYFHHTPINPSAGNLYGLCTSIDPRAQDQFITAEEDFKGYLDNDPRIYPRIDYRIFYADESFHEDLEVYKPVIIIDGFDPGDRRKIQDCDCELDPQCASASLSNGVFDPDRHRSMTDLMRYTDNIGENQNILSNLRAQGYDVIMVNQPTYNTTNLDTGETVTIDGGAYYIESNALALVALIKHIKQRLTEVNSDEDIAIVGPSMGGQISRYALAYMEQKFEETNDPDWDHKTRLWVSVDSPHLGANIPLGDQALIYLAGPVSGSDSANDFYFNQLGSIAAKQQLIEFHRNPLYPFDGPSVPYLANDEFLNGRVASQGYTYDHGSFFFRNYYNNQESNGLADSHGYPLNLRKIALVNGSLTGKTIGHNGENVLNIRGFQRVEIDLWIGSIVFDIHIASLESDFMPSNTAGFKKIARFKAGFDNITHQAMNINSRDNMDIVPGGWFAAQSEIAESILGTSPVNDLGGSFWEYPGNNIFYWFSNFSGDSEWQLREFRPNHSFIPSFSAIAHKNPDQSWLDPLDYNLVCKNDTYFDSYFGHDENTQHTSFTKESADWLFKELAGEEQLPNYPLENDDLNGDTSFCIDEIRTYAFGACKLPSHPTWYVSPNLEILDINNVTQSITVKALSNGNAHVSAIIEDGRSFNKNIFIGQPDVISIEKVSKIKTGLTDPINTIDSCEDIAFKLNMLPSNEEVFEVEWEQISSNFTWSTSDDEYVIISPQCNGQIFFKVRMKNDCGWSDWKTIEYDIKHCNDNCSDSNSGSITSDKFLIYPVPADDTLNVKVTNQDIGLLLDSQNLVIKLFTSSGWLVYEANATSTHTSINVSNLIAGVYTLVIEFDDILETHQIIIQ